MSDLICKVQRSLSHPDRMLVYSRDRKRVFFEGSITPGVAELLGADNKAYVEGHVDLDGTFVLRRRLDTNPGW